MVLINTERAAASVSANPCHVRWLVVVFSGKRNCEAWLGEAEQSGSEDKTLDPTSSLHSDEGLEHPVGQLGRHTPILFEDGPLNLSPRLVP